MDKATFYLQALQSGKYKELAWNIRAFTMTRKRPDEVIPEMYPYLEDNQWKIMLNGGEGEPIEGADPNEPLFNRKEKIVVRKGQIPGFLEDVQTNYGRVLFHYIAIVYAFGDKIPFRNERLNPRKDIEPIIAARLTDEPDDPTAERDPNLIYTDEYLRYSEAVGGLLAGLTQLFTPAATRKSLTTDPQVYVVRERRLKEAAAKGLLNDPAEIASIKKELGAMDKAWLKDDPAADYLIKDKSWKTVRMKTLLMHGEENGFGDGNQVTLIPTSLNEGWNLEHLPDYANSLREGSFNRGYQTMLGGEATQFLTRVFQNYAIVEDDCGSKLGLHRVIPVERATNFIGRYVLVSGKLIAITAENVSAYAGFRVEMRSPVFCQTGGSGTGYCKVCMGALNAKFANALGTMASDIGSTMMGIFMKKAHATELRTVRFDRKRSWR